MEIELGWGYHDLGQFDRFSQNRHQETKTIRKLLKLCDRLNIEFTFDVVGHLLHKNPPLSSTPHSDGWFSSIPNNGHPLFYAPDIVEMIQQSKTNHEICTHTYSHALCGKISDRVLEWELQRVNEVHQEIGESKPVSLVPPRHSVPSYEILEKSNIEIIRTIGYDPAPSRLHKLNKLVFEPPDPIEPRIVDGIVETYCSNYSTLTAATLPIGAESPLPIFRVIPTALRQRIHKRYLFRAMEKAVNQDSYIHLWTHLHDMANDEQWLPIRSFLEKLAHRRNQGDITVMPMKQLNEHVRDQTKDMTTEREIKIQGTV